MAWPHAGGQGSRAARRGKEGPNEQSIAKIRLKTRSVGRAPRETPTATWVELETFRTKALELGIRHSRRQR
jgi:hypothetical protein